MGPERSGGDKRHPNEIPEEERDYYLERKYPSYGNLAPRDISSRAAKEVCDDGAESARAAGAFISISPTR
jgi:succinate dehydrogenase/fumarate reductase flavoprotein subunit